MARIGSGTTGLDVGRFIEDLELMSFLRKINKYCLFLLVFSVTYEMWNPFRLVGTLSVTYMASALYFVSWIPFLRSDLVLSPFKKYVVPILLFLLTGLVSTALHSGYAERMIDSYNYRVLLLLILMFLMANHFYNDRRLVITTLNVYVASVVLMFLLVSFGIGTEFERGRLMLFGENPNLIGVKAVIAFFVVVANAVDNKFTFKRLFITILLVIPMLSLINMSASRGALVSVFLGFFIIIFLKKMSVVKKMVITVGSSVASFFLFLFALQNNEVLQKRMMRSIESGDIGRGHLWEGAIQIIADNIFLGVGFPGVRPEMLKYIGRYDDPHNVFIYVWMTTGVIGFFFYMIFIWNMVKNLYLSYRRNGHTIYILIFVIILINMAKAGGGIGKIVFWMFFAILIGSMFIDKRTSLDQNYKAETSQ